MAGSTKWRTKCFSLMQIFETLVCQTCSIQEMFKWKQHNTFSSYKIIFILFYCFDSIIGIVYRTNLFRRSWQLSATFQLVLFKFNVYLKETEIQHTFWFFPRDVFHSSLPLRIFNNQFHAQNHLQNNVKMNRGISIFATCTIGLPPLSKQVLKIGFLVFILINFCKLYKSFSFYYVSRQYSRRSEILIAFVLKIRW